MGFLHHGDTETRRRRGEQRSLAADGRGWTLIRSKQGPGSHQGSAFRGWVSEWPRRCTRNPCSAPAVLLPHLILVLPPVSPSFPVFSVSPCLCGELLSYGANDLLDRGHRA